MQTQASLNPLIKKLTKLFKDYELNYDQISYVTKKARQALRIKSDSRKHRKIERLSESEKDLLITTAYKMKDYTGLLLKTLLLTGLRISEFIKVKVEDLYFDEQLLVIKEFKGDKQRVIPMLPSHLQEISSYLKGRHQGYLFQSKRNTMYSPRRIQQIVKEIALKAGIKKHIHPHLFRHSIATFLLEKGMPLEQIQVFLGHERLETTRVYAKNSVEQIRDEFRKAMGQIV